MHTPSRDPAAPRISWPSIGIILTVLGSAGGLAVKINNAQVEQATHLQRIDDAISQTQSTIAANAEQRENEFNATKAEFSGDFRSSDQRISALEQDRIVLDREMADAAASIAALKEQYTSIKDVLAGIQSNLHDIGGDVANLSRSANAPIGRR